MNLPPMLKKFQAITKHTILNPRMPYMPYMPCTHANNTNLIAFIKDNKIKYSIIDRYGNKLDISVDAYASRIHAIKIYPYY